jgi:hypothetical protein
MLAKSAKQAFSDIIEEMLTNLRRSPAPPHKLPRIARRRSSCSRWVIIGTQGSLCSHSVQYRNEVYLLVCHDRHPTSGEDL